MRLGWFRPVHCKSLPAQEARALLTARKLVQTKIHDVEMSLGGFAWLWSESRPDDPTDFPWPDLRTGRRPCHAVNGGSGVAGGTQRAFRAMAQAVEAP